MDWKEHIKKTTIRWKKTHFPDEEAKWHIQNLLGNILGSHAKAHKWLEDKPLSQGSGQDNENK